MLLSTPDTAGSGVPGPEAFRPEAVGRLAGAGPPKRRGGGFPSHCCGLRQILLPSAHCYKIPILQTFLVLNLIKNILTTMPRNFEKGLLKLFCFKKKKKKKAKVMNLIPEHQSLVLFPQLASCTILYRYGNPQTSLLLKNWELDDF